MVIEVPVIADVQTVTEDQAVPIANTKIEKNAEEVVSYTRATPTTTNNTDGQQVNVSDLISYPEVMDVSTTSTARESTSTHGQCGPIIKVF